MAAIVALFAGIVFAVIALIRFGERAAGLRHLQLTAAITAGLFGIVAWTMLGDSRWLVGGVLFIGAGLPGWLAGGRRGLAVAALIVGLVGLALYGVASAHPMVSGPVPGEARGSGGMVG